MHDKLYMNMQCQLYDILIAIIELCGISYCIFLRITYAYTFDTFLTSLIIIRHINVHL